MQKSNEMVAKEAQEASDVAEAMEWAKKIFVGHEEAAKKAKVLGAIEVAKTTGDLYGALEAAGFAQYFEIDDVFNSLTAEDRAAIALALDRKVMEGVKRANARRIAQHVMIKVSLMKGVPVYEVARDDVRGIDYDSCLLDRETAQKLVKRMQQANWGVHTPPRFFVRVHRR